jgi:hypothetical protein
LESKLKYDKTSLEIIEVNYSVSPGGVDEFEVYRNEPHSNISNLLFSTPKLEEAVRYCYELGKDFTVRTLAEWEERELTYV